MENKNKPILHLIQNLKDGSINPSSLTKDERQQCTEVLMLEGYSISNIAQIADVSEKTVKRDIAEIRTRNSVAPSIDLVKQLVGNLIMKSESHQSRLMRFARANEGSVSERSQAEYMAWRVAKETAEILQSLGYLPLQPQKVVGDIFHHMEDGESVKSLDEIRLIVKEIEAVAQKTNYIDPEVAKELEVLNAEIERAQLSQKAHELLKKQTQSSEEIQNEN